MSNYLLAKASAHSFSICRGNPVNLASNIGVSATQKQVMCSIRYVGKDDSRPANLGLANHVILSLSNSYFGSGINVTTDNFFTSLHAAELLLKEKITMVGTVHENRREIPPALRT